jgi:hypothetical protein
LPTAIGLPERKYSDQATDAVHAYQQQPTAAGGKFRNHRGQHQHRSAIQQHATEWQRLG